MAIVSLHLSKSRFTTGLQCLKQLWWRVHEPDAPELVPGPELQALFDRGTRVGEAARSHVPGGTLIDEPYAALSRRVAATAAALATGAPAFYEAAFIAGDAFAAVDILERAGCSFRLIEVKSSTSVKHEHLNDAAFQTHVARASGLEVERVEIMHLNRGCAYPDLSDLFIREDVSDRVRDLLPGIPALIASQQRALRGQLPEVAIGPHCSTPYECPFHDRCWTGLPDHHVSTLYRSQARTAALEAAGYNTIDQLPDGLGLNAAAERQRRAVRNNSVVVEAGLARALRAFEPPLAFLDFETVAPPIPAWPGCHPYDAVPVQFSCHLERDGALEHREWLAQGAGDPRPELARRVIDACREARTVVAYNASFERSCLEAMAKALPDRADALRSIVARLADPLPLVRDHVYHPEFRGSFSLKAVLPALVPGPAYSVLGIAEGAVASLALERLMFDAASLAPGEAERLRADLTRYCALDTLGMARLIGRLRELAGKK